MGIYTHMRQPWTNCKKNHGVSEKLLFPSIGGLPPNQKINVAGYPDTVTTHQAKVDRNGKRQVAAENFKLVPKGRFNTFPYPTTSFTPTKSRSHFWGAHIENERCVCACGGSELGLADLKTDSTDPVSREKLKVDIVALGGVVTP